MRCKRHILSAFFISFFVCLFLTSALWAQEESDTWHLNKPITSITFKGLKNIKKSELDGITSSFINRPFTDELFGNLIDRLYALDFFDEIEPSAQHDRKKKGSVEIVFKVVEKPVVSRIIFSGNNKIRNGELKDVVSLKVDEIFVNTKMLVDERAIRDKYLEKGYLDVKVSSSTSEDEDGIVVTFGIEEGFNTIVTDIAFSNKMLYTVWR